MAITKKRDVHKKYTVSGAGGSDFAKTDTLDEAKRAGLAIGRKQYGRGKWNISIMTIHIDKQDAPGSIFYKPTGWVMYIPVAGTGRRIISSEKEIKRRYGVDPLKWTKKKKR